MQLLNKRVSRELRQLERPPKPGDVLRNLFYIFFDCMIVNHFYFVDIEFF